MISALPTAVGMNILFCFIRESISSQIDQLKWREAVRHRRLLIQFILFGIYIYNTKLFHHGQGDRNWHRESHEGVTKSRHT